MKDQVLRVELFQPFTQYRNPFTFYYAQSFPLPPPSTIYGLIGYLIDEYYGEDIPKRYDIAIMGKYASSFFHYTGMIKAKEINIDKNGQLVADGTPLYFKPKVSQRTPIYQTELFNVRLNLFFRGNKEDIEKLKIGLNSKVFTIGRGSDIAAIRNMDETPKLRETRYFDMEYGTYAPNNKLNELRQDSDLPVYYLSIQQAFLNQGKRIRSIHELGEKTEREVRFDKTYFLPFGRKFQFEKKHEAWLSDSGAAMPLFWWSDA